MGSFDWSCSVRSIKGVGDSFAEKLQSMGIFTLGDLLLHCPFRYENRTQLTLIQNMIPEQWAVVQGTITHTKCINASKKRYTITIEDETGNLPLTFFYMPPNWQQLCKIGRSLRCFGQVKAFMQGVQMVQPEYEIFDADNPPCLPQYLTPIYPSVEGITQKWLRKKVSEILTLYMASSTQQDTFSQKISPHVAVSTLSEALNTIHAPRPLMDLQPALHRFIAEEFFVQIVNLKKMRDHIDNKKAPILKVNKKIHQDFLKALPFQLTASQQKVWEVLQSDLSQEKPMLRLVQGDVGCGKTVVAALAALAALSSGWQVALMVPTEILAEQHYAHFASWFASLGYRCELFTGKLSAKEKRRLGENITLGLAQMVIGTHALFQESVQYHALGLVIIDEQHRFGVHQRLALQNKGENAFSQKSYPHQLIMTATPIPRTLSMSHYAHLDISIIEGLPPGRQPIKTAVIPQSRRNEIIERIHKICSMGQQVYWVCTLITESESLECQALETTTQYLQSQLPFNVGSVHGKMSATEKERVMQAFSQGEIHILVATTVIEVGVNVPAASLIIIENPERLGLAQLHQLRGRVGRGTEASFCLLLYQSPLTEMGEARLRILRESQDGFVIAEMDLTLRGPGEILGSKQTGMVPFKIADLHRDKKILEILTTLKIFDTDLPPAEWEQIKARWRPCEQILA